MSSQLFTCISCRVGFADVEIQRKHYKTDWHRYNLKRKVVNLPPVTAEEFQQKVIQQKEKEETLAQDTSTYCKPCRKTFSSRKAFDNHINSKKHRDAAAAYIASAEEMSVESGFSRSTADEIFAPARSCVKKDLENSEMDEDSDIDEVSSDEWDEEDEEISPDNPILNNNCLFCTHHSSSMTKNLKHMSVAHSFFIPDVEFVSDLKNLLLYLGEKVCKYFMCLWCNTSGRGFHSMEAVQTHMRDKGHCKVLHEGPTLAEFEQFYNYATSYPDYEEGMDVDEEIKLPELETEDYQLQLPSGGTVGHRALLAYYKQHYAANRGVAVKKNKLNRVISTYRALGWNETEKAVVEKKVKDIRYMKAVQSKMAMRLGVKANKLQPHFRLQVMF